MKTENKTCAERIRDEFDSRNQMIDEFYMWKANPEDFSNYDGPEHIDEFLLDKTEMRVIKLLLSTGGPADWIEVKLSSSNEVEEMKYVFQDWFDHAEITFGKDNYMWDFALDIIQDFEF